MQIQKQFQKAFSLIEISIVLIIIGLIAYGATSGNALINRARIIKMRDYTKSFSSLSVNKNLAFWIEASMSDAYETASDGTVTVIDKAIFDGARTDVVAPSSTTSPTYTEDVINRLPAFYFDGTNDCLLNDDVSIISSKPHTTFFVILPTDTSGSTTGDAIYAFNEDSLENVDVMLSYEDEIRVYYSSTPRTLSDSTTLHNNVVYGSFTADGTKVKGRLNGSEVLNITSSDYIASSDNFSIGQEYDGSTRSNFFEGYIGEILIYNKALTDSEIQQVEAYLTEKWKL